MQSRLESGISLAQVSPDLDFWSDASDVGWGAHLEDEVALGLWSPEEADLSINARELLVVERGLLQLCHLLSGSTVAVFVDNSTAVASKQARRNSFSRPQLHCSMDSPLGGVSPDCSSSPVHHGGKNNVLADSLSRLNQIQGSEWTLKWEVFQDLCNKWPVMIDLFATSLNHRCSLYFSPFLDPRALGTDALLRNWDGHQVYAFPPWSLVPLVLKKLLVLRSPHDYSGSVLASVAMVSRPARSGGGWSSSTSVVSRSSQTASLPLSSSRDPQAVSSCLATVQRFARAEGFSSRVASQIGFAWRASSCTNYQVRWSAYRQWCHSEGHSISRPTLPKIADFLFWLRKTRKLSVSSILGYRSMLSSGFCFKLPEISLSPVIKDLIRSFKVETPVRSVRPPSWDLDAVLRYLISSTFEPLSATPFHLLMKVLFLVALATAKRVWELQAISRYVSFSSCGACLAYVLEFLTMTESASHPLPRSFLVKPLADLDQDLLLCLVSSLREYLRRTSEVVNHPRHLFVSLRTSSRVMSKNGISYFL